MGHPPSPVHTMTARDRASGWLQAASARRSLWTAPSGRVLSQWSGCQDACLLSIARLCPLLGVHPIVARRPGSRCPAVRCPARPVSGYLAPSSGRGCPAIWCPARPASSRLVSVRPPGRSRLVPRPPGGGDGETSVRRGSGHDWTESSSMWSGPVPAARSTAPGGMVAGTAAEVVCRPAGERRRRTWAGWRFGGRLHPTDQAGQTAARAPVAGDCARAGSGRREVAARHRVGGHLGLEPRLLCVVVAEPDVRVDGPGRIKRARRPGWRAAPVRPRQVASATGSAATAL
jgi:hypothetical protein